MTENKKKWGKWLPAVIASLVLTTFGIIGASLVGFSYQGTAERIAQNEREALLKQLSIIVPQHRLDNDLLSDQITIQAPDDLGTDSTVVFRARKQGKPVAAVFSPVIARGYSGSISLLVGVYTDGSIAGVRVITHKETPGLGDKIEAERSDWIKGFDHKSLERPVADRWKVKRDGGDFDQFTGATITPRAIVSAVKSTLNYFSSHQDILFTLSE